MKDAASRAVVFVMVIIAIIVVVNDIKRQGVNQRLVEQAEIQDFENSNIAVSEIEEE